jgi:hypothetical protein
MALEVKREVLARMLREHGEDDLALRALSLSDDELARVGTLGDYYAFSEDAMAHGGSMGGARALSLAAIDVLEGSGRDLCRHHTERELAWGWSAEPGADERARDQELRRHSAERQIPADESQRVLDKLDPPAWGAAPRDATFLIRRCHELRTKPLRDFTVEDLRIMIGQQIGLRHLVPLALDRLRADPLVEGDHHPGDLLASVLGVDAGFWESGLDPEVEVRILAQSACERPELEPGLRELAEAFIRDHPRRSADRSSD